MAEICMWQKVILDKILDNNAQCTNAIYLVANQNNEIKAVCGNCYTSKYKPSLKYSDVLSNPLYFEVIRCPMQNYLQTSMFYSLNQVT
jgi:hypothetical protein